MEKLKSLSHAIVQRIFQQQTSVLHDRNLAAAEASRIGMCHDSETALNETGVKTK